MIIKYRYYYIMNYFGNIYNSLFPQPQSSKKSSSVESMYESPFADTSNNKNHTSRKSKTPQLLKITRRKKPTTRSYTKHMLAYKANRAATKDINNHPMQTRRIHRRLIQFSRKRLGNRIFELVKSRKIPEARANYLNMICSDSGVCIAFGQNTNMIKHHFKGFTDFTYLRNIKRIGKPSANGFINEFKYEREGYVAHAILKSAMKIDSDNLFYEYLVGQYVNKLNLLYPCFLETYGYFYYSSPDTWKHFKNNKTIAVDYKYNLDLQSPNITSVSFSNSCKDSQHLCILIQHINEAISMDSQLENIEFINHDLLYVLYQIYMPLAMHADTFTHYDLHTGNVLLYEPVKGNYIQYYYHINNEIVTFKCCYIVKIIDYGRSFFVDEPNPNKMTKTSESIYDEICKLAECNYTPPLSNSSNSSASMDSESSSNSSNSSESMASSSKTYSNLMHDTNVTSTASTASTASDAYTTKCGEAYGYTTVGPESTPGSFYHISGLKRNMSHDLRLLYIIKKYHNDNNNDDDLKSIINNVQYGFKTISDKYPDDDDDYGTMEQTKNEKIPYEINNVIDAHTALKSLIMQSQNKTANDRYFEKKQKLGDLYIYTDGRPMEFIKTA